MFHIIISSQYHHIMAGAAVSGGSGEGLRVSVSPNLSSVSQTGHNSDKLRLNTTAVSTSFQSFYYTRVRGH